MAYILLAVAVTLSSVAAFYSVVGLAAIFSGAFIPVIIMGSTLEIAKVLTTLWLHRHWNQVPILLKSYLTAAVVVLMMITSMGIFGFLSKAHIAQEYTQATLSTDSATLTESLASLDKQISDTTKQLEQLSSNTWFDEIKTRIQSEQSELNALETKKQQQLSSASDINDKLNAEITAAQDLLTKRKISALQSLLGIKPDGQYGASTKIAFDSYISSRRAKLAQTDTAVLDTQIKQAQDRIANLQSQLVSPEDSKLQIADLKKHLADLNSQRSEVADKLAATQKQINEFAVEVGPITFISELFFSSTDDSSSRTTVRMLIFTIIAVFDPLAILLVVAASMTIPTAANQPAHKVIHSKPETPPSLDSPIENTEDNLPSIDRLSELINLDGNTLSWKERDDKAFNARWANKPIGQQVTIDGKRYKTKAILDKLQRKVE